MSISKKILQGLRDYSSYVLWILGLVVILVGSFWNYYLANQLKPIEQNQVIMAKQLDSIQEDVNNIEKQHDNFVQKDSFNEVTKRLEAISNRLDQVYAIVATRDK